MLYLVLFVAISVGGYFTFRYLTLVSALRAIGRDLDRVQQDLTQNQMFHLPAPDPHLRKLLCSLNDLLEGIQQERQSYEKRERDFQKQIENISHDLRTPLTVILGYIKLYQQSDTDRPDRDQEAAEMMEIVRRKAETMRDLADQFYDFSRIYARDYPVMAEKVDAARFLREFFMENYQPIEDAGLKIQIDLPEHPVWVMGERGALERICHNLFQNAQRYGDTLFQIAVGKKKDHVEIRFVNDTSSLREEDLPRLFDRFYVKDLSRGQGGTGLGLTIARSLAEEMGGRLTAELLPEEEAVQGRMDQGEAVQGEALQKGEERRRICFCLELLVSS